MNMKKWIAILMLMVLTVMLTACSSSDNKPASNNAPVAGTAASANPLVDDYGFQTADTTQPILNDKGAAELSFTIYSSKNASAKDYNDMKIMNDLFAQTKVIFLRSSPSCRFSSCRMILSMVLLVRLALS